MRCGLLGKKLGHSYSPTPESMMPMVAILTKIRIFSFNFLY